MSTVWCRPPPASGVLSHNRAVSVPSRNFTGHFKDLSCPSIMIFADKHLLIAFKQHFHQGEGSSRDLLGNCEISRGFVESSTYNLDIFSNTTTAVSIQIETGPLHCLCCSCCWLQILSEFLRPIFECVEMNVPSPASRTVKSGGEEFFTSQVH